MPVGSKISRIEFDLKFIGSDEIFVSDGIEFNNCAFVIALMDGVIFLDNEYYSDSMIVFPELLKSASDSGEYLIFTCGCGIAGDGGWQLVHVLHCENLISWCVHRGGEMSTWTFDKKQYTDQVFRLAAAVKLLDPKIILEPSNVVFPD